MTKVEKRNQRLPCILLPHMSTATVAEVELLQVKQILSSSALHTPSTPESMRLRSDADLQPRVVLDHPARHPVRARKFNMARITCNLFSLCSEGTSVAIPNDNY